MPSGPPLEGASPQDPERAPDTRVVHPPASPPQSGAPIVTPLDFSSTYAFEDAAEFAEASQLKVGAGYVYTRWANPTIDAFEASVADLEGAETAEAFATGMAAITTTFLGLCSSGDRVVSARQLYGGTHELLNDFLPRFGIEAQTFDVHDFDGIENALPGAKILYCETIGNPRAVVADISRYASLASEAGALLVVDNTFASPLLCRPIELGASISIHSATKFIGGHHDLMGGVACGFESALEPVKALGREFGSTLAPFNAWLALRGIATMALRVERSSDSAFAVARFLSEHPEIEAVSYPALEAILQKSCAIRCWEAEAAERSGSISVGAARGRAASRRHFDW